MWPACGAKGLFVSWWQRDENPAIDLRRPWRAGLSARCLAVPLAGRNGAQGQCVWLFWRALPLARAISQRCENGCALAQGGILSPIGAHVGWPACITAALPALFALGRCLAGCASILGGMTAIRKPIAKPSWLASMKRKGGTTSSSGPRLQGQGYMVQSRAAGTGERYGGYSSHCLSAPVPVSSSSRMGVSVPSKEKPNRSRPRHGSFPERRA